MQQLEITILLFGACREAAGVDQLACRLDEPADVAAAWRALKQQHNALAGFERSALFAVNEEHARPDQTLREGDIVAIFPPVSGG